MIKNAIRNPRKHKYRTISPNFFSNILRRTKTPENPGILTDNPPRKFPEKSEMTKTQEIPGILTQTDRPKSQEIPEKP